MGRAKAGGSSLRHLRVFEMVARFESVRKAADAIHLTQPAVTQAIAKLEAQVGTALFERRSSGTYLTPAGTILAARIGRMFEQIETALANLGLPGGSGQPLASTAERITRPQIRALAAIANCHVVDEAQKAGVSQAALYHAARELERSLGHTILRHGVAGLSTTEEGADLARKLLIAMREFECGIEEIWADAEHRGGQLRVGAMPLAGSFLVAPVLNDLTKYFPHAHVEVRTGDSGYLSGALLRGEVDFMVGLCGLAKTDGIERELLVSLPYVLVARRNHPLTKKSKIGPADLAGYEWIAPSAQATRRVAFDRLMASLGRMPPARIEAASLSTVRLLLSGSDRLAMLTRFEFEYEKASGALSTLPFGPIEPAHSLGVARRSNWAPTPLHRKFLELVRSHARDISEAQPVSRLPAKAHAEQAA